MSEPVTTTAQPTAGQLFETLVGHLGADALAQIKTTLTNAAHKIENNPSTLEIAAQGIALQGALIAIGPGMQTDAIKSGAGTLRQLIALIPDVTVAQPVAATDAPAAAAAVGGTMNSG